MAKSVAKSTSQKATDTRQKWLKRITDERKAHGEQDGWIRQAERAQAAMFCDYHKNADQTRTIPESYPLFPSTIKVIHGRVFSQPPKPDVRKRYTDDAGIKPVPAAAGGGMGQPSLSGPAPAGGPAPGTGAPVMGAPGPGSAPPMPPQPGQPPAPMGGAPGQPPAAPVQTVDDNKLAQLIERALGYTIDTTDFDANGHMSVDDFLVAACGIAKVEMETVTEQQPVTNPLTGQPVMVHTETGEPAPLDIEGNPVIAEEEADSYEPAMQEVIVDQMCILRHFSWSQYHWEPQQNWAQVSWEAFDHWMTRAEIEDKFNVTLDSEGPTQEGNDRGTVGGDPKKPQSAKYKDQFCVHEIWDKKRKERLFICEDFKGVLLQEPDPLGLKDFYPNPKPMFLNVRGDDLVPMPDYTYCEILFEQCNDLSNRISKIIQSIKEVGFYDSSIPELAQVRGNPPDGTYIPVAGLAQRIAQAGGTSDGTINSVLARWDNQTAVAVIGELLNLTEVFKQRIWEIYGVPDILRGSTDPNETATAQQIKSQWADVRIGEKVRIVSLFFRDVFRIEAEIMAEKFEVDVLEKMTGITLNDLEIEVLRSDYGRGYAIDVESDSTVVQDEFAEKQQRMEFLNTITGFVEKILPAVQQGAVPGDLGKELILFALNTFKSGRQMEQAVNSIPDTMQQLGQFQQKIAGLEQQLKGANDMAQGLQKQLQGVNMQKEQRENVKTASDVQRQSVDNAKTDADTQHTLVLTAKDAQSIHTQSLQNHLVNDNVVPMGPRGAA